MLMEAFQSPQVAVVEFPSPTAVEQGGYTNCFVDCNFCRQLRLRLRKSLSFSLPNAGGCYVGFHQRDRRTRLLRCTNSMFPPFSEKTGRPGVPVMEFWVYHQTKAIIHMVVGAEHYLERRPS